MKSTLVYIAFGSLILNIYCNSTWLYSYFTTVGHSDAISKFRKFLPSLLSTSFLYVLTLILTLSSILIFAKFKTSSNYKLYNILMIAQILFMLLYMWQLL